MQGMNWYIDAWKNYGVFVGRSRRKGFWISDFSMREARITPRTPWLCNMVSRRVDLRVESR